MMAKTSIEPFSSANIAAKFWQRQVRLSITLRTNDDVFLRRPGNETMQPPASDVGPSDGQPSTPTVRRQLACFPSTVGETDKPRLLRAAVKRNNIDDLKALLTAYNATTVAGERAVLFEWIRSFCEHAAENLTAENVLDYSEMTKIIVRFEEEKDVLKKLVTDICSTLSQGEFLGKNYATGLCRSLIYVRPAVYGGGAQLAVVATKLLDSLCGSPKLTRNNFADYEATFLALKQTFFQLHETCHNGINEKEKRKLRNTIVDKERFLELSCDYYPVTFHFKVIRQAVERLEVKDVPMQFSQAMRIGRGLCLLCVFHCLRNLVLCDDDALFRETVRKKAQEALDSSMGLTRREWYDLLRDLMVARDWTLGEAARSEPFENAFDVVVQKQHELGEESDQKALRYGVIQETKLLATWSSDEDVRRSATKKLTELTKSQDVFEGWFDDEDLLHAFLDTACEIYAMGQSNQEIVEAIRELQQSCKSPGKEALTAWLGGATIEDKLRPRRRRVMKREGEDLFVKSGREVGYVPLSTIRSNIENLKEAYKDEEFATVSVFSVSVCLNADGAFFEVSSLFEQSSRRHVKDMAHYIVMYEEIVEQRETDDDEASGHTQRGGGGEGSFANDGNDHSKEHYERKRKVRRPVPIADFFKPRSFEKGTPKKEIRKVLLYGNPGSGKTCISKLIAHRWALGEIMHEFQAVYLIPFRKLNAKLRGSQGGTLKDVVVKLCFMKASNDEVFEDSRTQVENDLAESTTLLIFDGLDEAGDEARDLLFEAEKRQCKLLVLTRLYNLGQIQTRMDFKVECIGFNDQQLEQFINKELHKDEASKLMASLQQNRALWEMACIPVTACTLCSFAKHQETAAQGQRNLISMYQMYNGMADYVWKRFEEKPEAGRAKKKDIFDDLEKIACEALRAGQILIEERIVQHHATTTNAPTFFKESGFLLLKLEGQEYQFPHLTFQEYFAARYVARCLREKVPNEEKKVREFIDRGKYDEKNALTMSFAMHALAADGQDIDTLHDILSLFDSQSVEVLGMQHFFLRMRALEATLEEARRRDVLDPLLRDEKANKIAEGARHLVKSTIDDAAIREIVVENLERCFRVLEYFPKILKDTVEEAKKELVSDKTLQENDISKIQNVLKLAKHSDVHINDIAQELSREMNKVENKDSAKDIIWRLGLVAEEVPYVAEKLVSVLKKGCDDVHANVRESAMVCIGKLARVAPHLASSLLPMLTKGCNDKSLQVRNALPEAIGRFVKEAPRLAVDLIPMLETLYEDKSPRVRRNIMDAIAGIAEALPHLVGELETILKKGCDDKIHWVHTSAMKTVGKIVKTAPHLADELLRIVVGWCSDEDWCMRLTAIKAINLVIETAAPMLDGNLLSILVEWCGDKERFVCRKVMRVICCALKDAPRLPLDLLPILVNWCSDEDWKLGQKARDALSRVVEASPLIADSLLPMLVKECSNEDWWARRNAMETIARVVGNMPRLASDLLPIMVRACSDESWQVRAKAIKAIGCIVGVAPPLASDVLAILKKCQNEELWQVREKAMEAIGRLVVAAPQFVDEFMSLLVKWFDDELLHVRKKAMKITCHIVGTAPQLAGVLLPIVMKKCGDEKWTARKMAVEVIGCFMEAPQFAAELLPLLVKWLDDEPFHVRKKAIEAIKTLKFSASPDHLEKLVSMLDKGHKDKDPGVRKIAMEAIGTIIRKSPRLVGELLSMLERGCKDDHPDVCKSAVESIGTVVKNSPETAGILLETLKQACTHEHYLVRASAMEAIGIVIGVSEPHAEDMLKMIEILNDDSDVRVRATVMEAVGRLIKTLPHLADRLFAMVKRSCNDEDFNVRDIARTILDGLKTEELMFLTFKFLRKYERGHALLFARHPITLDRPTEGNVAFFVLHTTSSQIIWTSDKIVIDEYVRSLKREFEDNFPGLLEHFNTEDE